MARSSRGRGRRQSTKRNVDWVVNELTYDVGSPFQLPDNAIVFAALTVPQWAVAYMDPTGTVPQPGYWLPEQDSGMVAYAVRGHVEMEPSTWGLGDAYRVALRLAKFPVEYGSALDVLNDPAYSCFQARFANERFLWQKIIRQRFSDGTAPEVHMVSWKGVCKIEPNEALCLVCENQSAQTIRVDFRPYLRTLVRANG